MEQEKKNSLGELMKITMENIKVMADANTIIGTPIQAEGVTLIPVSKMSFGMGGGGTEFSTKSGGTKDSFGGGSAASAKLEPVAFLIVKEDGSVKLLPVAPPPATAVGRLIDTVPEVVDKVTGFIEEQQEKKAKKEAEADFAE
ncbi:sporulation protein YtfJ [Colidextribacter sp. OB.20]|uniref:GerW family sporulation protein n=1 Tax=Colidextribacter sp. OB.20 TaxID=2304568 RepID=UPI0013685197|nr:spore germination protein GerW family protein [Colidextribacter sp. OB.20]NBI08535.1 sporulation protein YtfJ [Colidextribacter sp. OB.20]